MSTAEPAAATDRDGVRIGIDVGSVRVGVAVSDPDGLLATPLVTLARDRGERSDLDELTALVAERRAVEVVVGLPRHLSGMEGAAVSAARDYASALASRVAPVPVRLVDERLTTVSAARELRAAGVRSRDQRAVIDQAAAVAILQSVLDARRAARRSDVHEPTELPDLPDLPALPAVRTRGGGRRAGRGAGRGRHGSGRLGP